MYWVVFIFEYKNTQYNSIFYNGTHVDITKELKSLSFDKKLETKRLEVLKNSLIKKEKKLDKKFDNHFSDVKSANGQPLNDKRNGQATFNRWEKQNNSIRNQIESVEKTKQAIENEEWKIYNTNATNEKIPIEILALVKSGELTQWRKFPTTFFVKGVDKGRLYWDIKEVTVKFSYIILFLENYYYVRNFALKTNLNYFLW
ncbi:MAG: hypothetical protein EAZ53_17345, partial [Bacteroidetes bacterium]